MVRHPFNFWNQDSADSCYLPFGHGYDSSETHNEILMNNVSYFYCKDLSLWSSVFLFFKDEWSNFLARIRKDEASSESELFENPNDALELRFWASYRGQTLARTGKTFKIHYVFIIDVTCVSYRNEKNLCLFIVCEQPTLHEIYLCRFAHILDSWGFLVLPSSYPRKFHP